MIIAKFSKFKKLGNSYSILNSKKNLKKNKPKTFLNFLICSILLLFYILINKNPKSQNNILLNISLPKEEIKKYENKSYNWYLTA